MSDIRREMRSDELKRRSNDFTQCLSRDKRTFAIHWLAFISIYFIYKTGVTLVAGIRLRSGFNPLMGGVCIDGPEGFVLTPPVALMVRKVIIQLDCNDNNND